MAQPDAKIIAAQLESAAEDRAASSLAGVKSHAELQLKVANNSRHSRTCFHGALSCSFPQIMSHFLIMIRSAMTSADTQQ